MRHTRATKIYCVSYVCVFVYGVVCTQCTVYTVHTIAQFEPEGEKLRNGAICMQRESITKSKPSQEKPAKTKSMLCILIFALRDAILTKVYFRDPEYETIPT